MKIPERAKRLFHGGPGEAYWKRSLSVPSGIRQKLKENAILTARKSGLRTPKKFRSKKSTFPTYPPQKIALDAHQSPTCEGDSRAAMLTETSLNNVLTCANYRKGLHMCTLTHFLPAHTPPARPFASSHPARFHEADVLAEIYVTPRFQVVLAGNSFFHIKEISTGTVRGFRCNHNEACALARSLEVRG